MWSDQCYDAEGFCRRFLSASGNPQCRFLTAYASMLNMYKKIFTDNGGDKDTVCAALGLETDAWNEQCSTADGFVDRYFDDCGSGKVFTDNGGVWGLEADERNEAAERNEQCDGARERSRSPRVKLHLARQRERFMKLLGGNSVEYVPLDVYKKIFSENKGDKDKVRAALHVSPSEWSRLRARLRSRAPGSALGAEPALRSLMSLR